MDIASKKPIESNFAILPKATTKAFVFLSKQNWIGENKWYLAGGTALALQTGNRKSVDLDFFTTDSNFNSKLILDNFQNDKNWQINFEENSNTLYGELFGAKISFIAYPFFIPKQKFIEYGAIKILHPLDIAVMKIIAISQRGRKRDFFDLFWCAKNIETLENLVKRLKTQYPSVAHDFHHILKSLVYFIDAESDPEPEIYFETNWQEVKNFFEKEVLMLTQKIIINA